MTNGIFYAHSGLRFLVLLLGVAALAYYAYGMATGRPFDRTASLLRVAWVASVDLQVVLGLVLVLLGIWYPMLAGHLVLMLAALVVAHVTSVMARRSALTDAVRSHRLMLIGVVLALLLIVGGIMAIGRPLLGTGRPGLL